MFNFNLLRGKTPFTGTTTGGSWFKSGVVCPDGTVMWLSEEDESESTVTNDADQVMIFQPPIKGTPMEPLTSPKPDYLIGFLY